LGPEKFLAYHDVEIEIDEYKNDIYSLGIVFLYIQVPEVKIKSINELIMAKMKEKDCKTYKFTVFKSQLKDYDLV
jgi:hypothetical protein